MVCCANYWRRHAIDEAGVTGCRLQKILFFLAALTAISYLSFEPMTILCASMALLLYSIGLIGAQKRNARYLFAYGTISLCTIIAGIVAFGVVAIFFASSGHFSHRHNGGGELASLHGHLSNIGMITKGPFVPELQSTTRPAPTAAGGVKKGPFVPELQPTVAATVAKHGVYVPELESKPSETHAKLVDLEKPATLMIAHLLNLQKATLGKPWLLEQPPKQQQKRQPIDAVEKKHEKHHESSDDSSDDVDEELGATHASYRITGFGWFVIVLSCAVALFMFALKICTIRLAFQMRRQLIAIGAQRLPVTTPKTSACAAAVCAAAPVPSVFAPSTRRECARCTFVNAQGAQRCAMCDSQLPLVSSSNVVTPKMSGLYPLNQPLN